MPSALLKPCAYPGGCAALVPAGYCADHRPRTAHTTAARGYTWRWRQFRLWFIDQLVAFGIAPVCGARWPGAAATGDSQCQRDGVLTATRLHLDHTPPLRPAERAIEATVCDIWRVQLLCEACHNAKSAKELAAGGGAQ